MTMTTNKVTILEGGFATQISKYVGPVVNGDPLWTARFNYTNPDAVVRTHLDFLEAGAQIIKTNTYQASVGGFSKYLSLNHEQSIDLMKKTVMLAHCEDVI